MSFSHNDQKVIKPLVKRGSSKLKLPKDFRARFMLLVSGVLGLALYVQRAQIDEILSLGRAGGFVLVFLTPLYCLWGVGLIACLVTAISNGLKGIWFQPLFLLIVLILGYTLPLPPLPEEIFFTQHRSEFEEVIQILKVDGLPPGTTRCQASIAYELPSHYEHLTTQCVFVHNSSVVEFSPTRSAFSIVYVDKPESLVLSSDCSIRGRVWENLDENWYICVDADD